MRLSPSFHSQPELVPIVRMTDDTLFRRFVLYPRAFPAGSNVLDPDWLFSFVETRRDSCWEMSFTSATDMPDDSEAHSHGCATAEKQNAAFEKREGRPPGEEDGKVHYLGFYLLHKWALSSPKLEYLTTAIAPMPEDGNSAHFAYMLFPTFNSSTSNKKRRNDMRKIRQFLRECMMGPVRHVCDDKAASDNGSLDGIKMPVEPTLSLPDIQAKFLPSGSM
jgi:hypothetical protein